MHEMQQYLVEEAVENYQAGAISRRELLRRAALITGSVAVAQSLVSGLAPVALAAPPTRPEVQAGVTVSPDDPDIAAAAIDFPGDDTTLKGYLAHPRGAGPFAAVLVIHAQGGVNAHVADLTRRFAKQGYVGLAIDLLSRQGGTDAFADNAQIAGALGQAPPAQIAGDLDAGVTHLANLPYVRPQSIGAVGHCYGGGQTWRLAVSNPNVAAAVPYYGANPPLDAIPNLRAPVLAFYAGNDERLNAGIPALEAALTAAGKTYEIVMYPGTEHAFFNDTGAVYNAEAARDSWSRMLAWFGQYLRA